MAETKEYKWTISTATILKIVLVLLALWFVFVIKDIIALIFIAFVLSSAFMPWVDKLQERRIPRVASIIAIAVLVLGLLSVSIVTIVPALVRDTSQLAARLPQLYESVAGSLLGSDATTELGLSTIQDNLEAISKGLLQLTGSIFGTLASVFGGVASFLSVLVISFFMSAERDGMRKLISSVSPEKYQPYLAQLLTKIQQKLGRWLRGQLLLSLVISVLTYIGLSILGVKYALVLALLAGFLEIIPFIGPILAAIPAVFFAATESSLLAILVVILYVIVQQLENNILVPKVMQQTIGVHPIIILVALLIGGRLGGVVGIILAVPVVTIIDVFVRDLFEDRKAKRTTLSQDGSPM